MIETGRLVLRPFCKEDTDIISRLYMDDEIMKYMPYDCRDLHRVEKRLESLVSQWESTPVLNMEMAVILKQTGEKIGRCHLQLDTDSETGMVGWLLLKKEWNKGYATEITQKLMQYAFEELGLHRVSAICNPENTASWKVMEKCGMRREAHYRNKCKYIKKSGVSWNDELEYAILAQEWQNKH